MNDQKKVFSLQNKILLTLRLGMVIFESSAYYRVLNYYQYSRTAMFLKFQYRVGTKIPVLLKTLLALLWCLLSLMFKRSMSVFISIFMEKSSVIILQNFSFFCSTKERIQMSYVMSENEFSTGEKNLSFIHKFFNHTIKLCIKLLLNILNNAVFL